MTPLDDSAPESTPDQRRPPPAPNAAFVLIALGREVSEMVDRRLRAAQLTYRRFSVLGHLRADPGTTFTDLARRAGVSMQAIHAVIRTLEADGLVERTVTGRGRHADLQLTALGLHQLELGKTILEDVSKQVTNPISDAERAELVCSLMHYIGQSAAEVCSAKGGAQRGVRLRPRHHWLEDAPSGVPQPSKRAAIQDPATTDLNV